MKCCDHSLNAALSTLWRDHEGGRASGDGLMPRFTNDEEKAFSRLLTGDDSPVVPSTR